VGRFDGLSRTRAKLHSDANADKSVDIGRDRFRIICSTFLLDNAPN
jgi:hypothetical protein